MNRYEQQIREAVEATVVTATRFTLQGQSSAPLAKRIRQELTSKSARDYLVYQLKNRLYARLYCPGSLQAERGATVEAESSAAFEEALSAANTGKGFWEEGWTVRQTRDAEGRIVVEQHGLRVHARPEQALPSDGLQAGQRIKLRFPKEFRSLSPGFYMAVGDRDLFDHAPEQVVRLYWNLVPQGAARLMRAVTSALNAAEIPFRLKVLNRPQQYDRCDAGVLYVDKRDFAAVMARVGRLYGEVAPYLKSSVPAFTKKVANGLGCSEDPGDQESFGMNRCRLLAEGLLLAYEQGKRTVDERMQTVRERFLQDGILLEAPYLNPGSGDIYSMQSLLQVEASEWRGETIQHEEPLTRQELLSAAQDIAAQLLEQAFRAGGRWTWMGDGGEATLGQGSSYRTLGGDLYNGTSGIGLFLAELYGQTGDEELRVAALGAIRQALAKRKEIAPDLRTGLYTGWTGIAYAAARGGLLCRDEELLTQARELLARTARHPADKREFDIISGAAGAAAAVLSLGELLAEPAHLDLAVLLGERLLKAAERKGDMYSWPDPRHLEQRHLTGFSHGAAGAAYALLELYRATGEARYLHAAEGALRYEERCFLPERKNWPDYRGVTGVDRHGEPHSCVSYWCHGAPGIALSRLHAYEVTGWALYQEQALTALHTTRQHVERQLQEGTGNYSLCHGLSGNAEVLVLGERVLGRDVFTGARVAERVATSGLERYAKRGLPWPGGTTSGGRTPGLLLGDAGVGLFYLRLYEPNIPSVLLAARQMQNKEILLRY
ncbi:lanthionine synthetase-like protein [Tumebacillus sp. BK434]|uniref:lanthionine synthetase LanC family protein n=1 Tax=Tumebacillus sp. BK434 TaxID=2512169 RepID=UPI00104A2209|nr:lanthionine synthetase LanC family protein [Tumebacillus sp. BK434]TCP58183.1 lanthionine synthetase-like protein [Tumebacillus sp. BK434]